PLDGRAPTCEAHHENAHGQGGRRLPTAFLGAAPGVHPRHRMRCPHLSALRPQATVLVEAAPPARGHRTPRKRRAGIAESWDCRLTPPTAVRGGRARRGW